jgi:SOS-response transcriptional repressor LexA
MTIAERVKEERIKLGLTQAELAKLIGITQQSLQKIEDGKTQNPRKLLSLSKALNCTPEWLELGERGEIRESIPDYTDQHNLSLNQEKSKLRPIISQEQVIDWPTIKIDKEQVEWQHTTFNASKNSFWLKVIGDHMTSLSGVSIPEGYLIFVEPSLTPINGDLVIAKMKDSNEVTFKKLVTDAGRTYLKPLNQNYHAIEVTENFQIVGVVTEARLVFRM